MQLCDAHIDCCINRAIHWHDSNWIHKISYKSGLIKSLGVKLKVVDIMLNECSFTWHKSCVSDSQNAGLRIYRGENFKMQKSWCQMNHCIYIHWFVILFCRIFRAIDVAFSMNGVDFPDSYSKSVGFKIPSVAGAQGRWVSVPLNNTVARAMRVTLHASSPQILISEITFENGMLIVILWLL